MLMFGNCLACELHWTVGVSSLRHAPGRVQKPLGEVIESERITFAWWLSFDRKL